MITEQDLLEAIAECNGVRDPNAATCLKLASYYTIRDHMYPKMAEVPSVPYSYKAPPSEADITIDFSGDTDFARAINGRDQRDVWPVMDELMTAIRVLNPRLYAATIRKLNDL